MKAKHENICIYPKPIRILGLTLACIAGIFSSFEMITSEAIKFHISGYIALICSSILTLAIVVIAFVSYILRKPAIFIENGLWHEFRFNKIQYITIDLNSIQELAIVKDQCKQIIITFLSPNKPPHKTPLTNILFGDLNKLCDRLQTFIDKEIAKH